MDNAKSAYAMQFYASDGRPMPRLFLRYRPASMLPTSQLFKEVIAGS